MKAAFSILAGALLSGAAQAAEIALPPDATLAGSDASPFAAVRLPWGPWSEAVLPTIDLEGSVIRRAWRIAPGSQTPDQLLAPIREQLVSEGYAQLYACADKACGGYDFRFALDLIPPPAMHVDLGDYRYLLVARDTGAGRRLVAVVTSRGMDAGFIHATEVETLPDGAAAAAVPEPMAPVEPEEDPGPTAPTPSADGLVDRLVTDGHAVLRGLDFPSGSASLSDDEYPGLRAIAEFLTDNQTAQIALVGHTDAVGAADANLRLSRARAQAVRTRLIGTYGADPGRIVADGAGYLAPVASNATPEGRAENRRVEVVLLPAP
jgi:outer membrane protein OmpA-like peptidoglycan-associated protein